MKITIVGIGYVGLSNAILLAQKNDVIALDIVKEKVDMINNRISPIEDVEIQEYLSNKKLKLKATLDIVFAYKDADYIIISTPTDYDITTNMFNTSSIENVIKQILNINPNTTIIIKSTVPVGYTKELKRLLNYNNIIFSPEFLREGKALYDNLFPSRIIIGEKSKKAREIANLFLEATIHKNAPVLFMESTEAEAVKLFSNTYLALRVAYFNELDSYAELKNLDTKSIIDGVVLDPRIGSHYNNPSFGYGGYCLPKDTKQLRANYKNIPHNLITSIVESNDTRIKHIASRIKKRNPKVVGIYRLVMKSASDNIRTSAVQKVIDELSLNNIEVVIYEPVLNESTFGNHKVINDINEFKEKSDVIVANRLSYEIKDVANKIYSRDIYNRD